MFKNFSVKTFALDMVLEKAPPYLWNNIHWGQVWFWTLFAFTTLVLWHYPQHPLGRWRTRQQNGVNLFTGSPIYAGVTLFFTLVAHLALFTALSAISHTHGADLGLKIGAGLAALLIFTAIIPTGLWSRRHWSLLLCDSLYFLIFLSWAGKVMGGR